jgi:hypothetical protein
MGGTYRIERWYRGTNLHRGHLNFLALLSYVLHLTIRVLQDLLPNSCFLAEQPTNNRCGRLTHHLTVARPDTMIK